MEEGPNMEWCHMEQATLWKRGLIWGVVSYGTSHIMEEGPNMEWCHMEQATLWKRGLIRGGVPGNNNTATRTR